MKTALAFLKKGYQVIPLSKKTGSPVIKFKDIPITEELIKSINWNNCDYAILMRGVWAIDIDTHAMDPITAQGLKFLLKSQKADLFSILSTDHNNFGLDGYSSILRSEYKGEFIQNFKNTFFELTTSGGMHILFKKREDIPYSQKIGILPGVDIKANENNYVKIFPSEGREVLQAVKNLPVYEGKFEKEVFKAKPKIVTNYFQQSLPTIQGNGSHEGRDAYNRILEGTWMNRNDDLFKAACWAIESGRAIEPLSVLIGSVKGRDEFTREEFERTIESARRKVASSGYIINGT